MKTHPQFILPLVLAAFIASVPKLAFYDALSSDSIRDAYMLGNRNDFKTTEFLSKYRREFHKPESSAHVEWTRIETPFEQVVRLGQ